MPAWEHLTASQRQVEASSGERGCHRQPAGTGKAQWRVLACPCDPPEGKRALRLDMSEHVVPLWQAGVQLSPDKRPGGIATAAILPNNGGPLHSGPRGSATRASWVNRRQGGGYSRFPHCKIWRLLHPLTKLCFSLLVFVLSSHSCASIAASILPLLIPLAWGSEVLFVWSFVTYLNRASRW